MYRAFAYVGGNWNNDLNCGPFYANLYNSATNSNTNIGAAQSYSATSSFDNAVHIAAERCSATRFLRNADKINEKK